MNTEKNISCGLSSMRKYLYVGSTVSALMVFGMGGWAATSEISGAVIAGGTVEVLSDVKKVQHLTGGVVAEIFVKEGQNVKQGQTLIRLDETVTRANLAMVEKSLYELKASRARLLAERDDVSEIDFPVDLKEKASEPSVADILKSESRLFELRRTARNGNKSQLQERISQLEQEVAGYDAQILSTDDQEKFITQELSAAHELYQKDLIPLSKISSLEREAARLKGDKGRFIAAIAQTKGRISETKVQILQLDRDMNSEVAKELRETDAKIGEMEERRTAAQYQLDHIMVEAPQDGVVHQLDFKTVGGVIQPGALIMEIVPVNDQLVVSARISPTDVDQLHVGADARMRLSAFNQRTTPELTGSLKFISADITTDQRTGVSYYKVRVAFDEGELDKLTNKGLTVVPGMPVEVYIHTQTRTVASLLVKPFQDQMSRAFRQE
ncbi:MAG: HlyD family type I secretion periplasmic adaptor subunit [Hyphomicrobium sp.]